MLQWMGGSRRKVTASRKSTEKRQKQYFEQRRRQQQLQPTCTEGLNNGITGGQQHQKEQGSLDVLSFLNLSQISQNFKSSHPNGNGNQQAKNHTQKGPQSFVTGVFSGCVAENDEATIPQSGNQETIVSTEKGAFCSANVHVSSQLNTKPDLLNVDSEGDSVFDLLGDDDGDEKLQEGNVHEAHVAFSVQGLGTVGAQTPPQSPTRVRASLGHCFPHGITSREPSFSNNFDYLIDSTGSQVDKMIQDVVMPLGGCPSEFFPVVLDSYETERQKPSFFADCAQCDCYSCEVESSFGGADSISSYNWKGSWEDTPSFVDYFLDERHDDSWKIWPYETNGRSTGFIKCGEDMGSDYMVSGANSLKKRDYQVTKFSNPDSTSPENAKFNHDFSSSPAARYPMVGKSSAFSFGDIAFQQDWLNRATEDAKDTTTSLLSEESCSSSAVWDGASNNRDPSLTSRQNGRICNTFDSTQSKQCPVDIYAKQANHKLRDGLRGSHRPGPGICTRKSISPDSIPPKDTSCLCRDKTEKSDNLFVGSYSLKGKVDFGPFTHTSNTYFPSLESKLQKVDPMAAFRVPDLYVHVKPIFNQEKSAFSQPFDCTRYEKCPMFSKVGCAPIRDLSLNSLDEMPSKKPLDVASAHWNSKFSALSAEGSASKYEDNKSELKSLEFELQGRTSGTSQKVSVSKDHRARASPTPKMKDVKLKEENRTLNLKLKPNVANIAEHADETASSVKIPEKSESTVDQNGTSHGSEASLPCPSESEGKETAWSEEARVARKNQADGIGSCEKVMMLESYVLQLLCVQKVPEVKGVSALESIKK